LKGLVGLVQEEFQPLRQLSCVTPVMLGVGIAMFVECQE
jgi:hypothetical protein